MQKEKEMKDAKKTKTKKQREQIAMERRVSPRRAHAPTEQSSSSAVRKDLLKNTTSYSESTTLVEQIEEERQIIRHSQRILPMKPAPPVKMSAKRTATALTVATKTPAVRSLGLPRQQKPHALAKQQRHSQ